MTDDSPYQDLKDAGTNARNAAKKVDDFATHSTSRILGPLATKLRAGVNYLYEKWAASGEPEDAQPEEIPDVQDT